MIYLLKLTACSALFLLVYLGLLQREKMFAFNRVFLLTGLVLPLLIPLIAFETSPLLSSGPTRITEAGEWVYAFSTAAEAPGETVATGHTPKTPRNYLLLFYLSITGLLLLRFTRNLWILWRNIRSHEHISFMNRPLVLRNKPVSPHSFMGYILVNREDWLEGRIEKEILYHEYLHGKLYHSADILLVELLQVFCWFNPVLYFYKHAIGLNHEFQVDERVLKRFDDPSKYGYLLLNHAVMPAQGFSHSFNFIHLKKRIRMISAKSNPVLIPLKAALTVIFTGFAVFLFAEKTFAQQLRKALPAVQSEENKPAAKTATEEFDQLASKALTHSLKGKPYRFTMAETNRLGDLYSRMTEDEKSNKKLTLRAKGKPSKATPPTKAQFESFKDPKMYGVWLDGKRVPNHVLNNYEHTDFADFWQSILLKNAVHYGQYKYHLELSTPKARQAYLEEMKKDTSRYWVGYSPDFIRQIRAITQ